MNELEDNLNDYIEGSISFLTYRERRTDYINQFVGSGYLPDDTIPLKETDQAKIKAAIKEKIQSSTPLDTSTYTIQGSPSLSGQSLKQYIGLAVLIIAAVLAWYYSSQLPKENNSSSISSSVSHEAKTKLSQNDSAKPTHEKRRFEQAFVTNFLNMDKWNSDTLSEFLVKWQKLSRTEKKQTKQTQSFIRLKNSLRLRIQEQQALQSTKNKIAERQENLLVWFASQIPVTIN